MSSPLLTPYRTIADRICVETEEKKSRFLCALIPVAEEADATSALRLIRDQEPGANHHCFAYRLRDGTERMSDDGEPSGTAGRPILHVLQQHQLVDLIAIVTRYFGGTLLGAGGLVRAYSHAVAEAVTRSTVVQYAPHDRYDFTVSYADYTYALQRLEHPQWELVADFAEHVHLTLFCPTEDRSLVTPHITALTRSTDAAVPIDQTLRPLRFASR